MRRIWFATVLVAMTGATIAMETPPAQEQEGMTLAALRIAYQREIDSQQAYAAFAVRAEQEEYLGVRDLFTALVDCEGIHARIHKLSLALMDVTPVAEPADTVVGFTVENLCTAFENEINERKVVYRAFMEYARAECQYDALARLRYARDAEATHARALNEAYFHLAEMRDPRVYFVCPACGALHCEASTTSCDCGALASSMRAVEPWPRREVSSDRASLE
jgi:rubrerythrin